MTPVFLLALACASKEQPADDANSPTDADADTDSDADTDADTDTDTDTETSLPYDGTYQGTLTIDATESGFAFWSESCAEPLTLTVAPSSFAPSSFAASIDCFFPSPMGGEIHVELTGAVATAPEIAGTAWVTRNDVDQTGPLTGSFQADGSLDLAFSGDYTSGDYALTWDGSAIVRP